MAKKKAKAKHVIVFSNGDMADIVSQNGKYWFTADSQFRKAGPFDVRVVEADPQEEEKTEEGE